MVYMCNGILVTYKKEWISEACHSTDEPGKHHVKGNRSDKRHKHRKIQLIGGIHNSQIHRDRKLNE